MLVGRALQLLACTIACAHGLIPTVRTSFGDVVGQSAHGCDSFLGIPFAEPPVRFEAAAPWSRPFPSGRLNASQYGPWCPQLEDGAVVDGSEDCLFLNIWKPAGVQPGENLPTMVWVYGGNFVAGDGGDASAPNTYDGCALSSKHDVVVVTMNYRVGALGFGTLMRDDGEVDGNWGLKDQREALRWVQGQVASFGGHAHRVTLFGESAGAMSIWNHLVSPPSNGLFQAAICESGRPEAASARYGLERNALWGHSLGCVNQTTLRDCLKNKTLTQLVTRAGGAAFTSGWTALEWGPTYGTIDLPDEPRKLFALNKTSGVPILVGFNTDEANVFIYPKYPTGLNSSEYVHSMHQFLQQHDPEDNLNSSQFSQVLQAYPAQVDSRQAFSEFLTDWFFRCETMHTASVYSQHHNQVHMYRFNQRASFQRSSPIPGVYHGMELPFVFGTDWSYGANFTQAEKALTRRMQSIWTSMARKSNPGAGFPRFNTSSPRGLVLQAQPGDTIEVVPLNKCAVLATIWDETIHKYSNR